MRVVARFRRSQPALAGYDPEGRKIAAPGNAVQRVEKSMRDERASALASSRVHEQVEPRHARWRRNPFESEVEVEVGQDGLQVRRVFGHLERGHETPLGMVMADGRDHGRAPLRVRWNQPSWAFLG